MANKDELLEVQEALKEFIINSTKKGASSYAVQALPEAVKQYIELINLMTRVR